MIYFVTGKSGSGKSTFSNMLAEKLNYKYIDVDKIGHKVYEYPEIIKIATNLFGKEIFDESGNLNRKKLGQIVFSERHSPRVKEFSDLTWCYMKELLDKEIIDNSVVDWILLPHTKYWQMNAVKILIIPNNNKMRYEKLILRDGVGEEYLKLRDKASIEYNENEFDYIFKNTYCLKDMIKNVKLVIK